MPFSFDVVPHVLATPIKSLLGFCDLVIDGKLVITGFKVFRNSKNDSLFVSAPSQESKKKDESGKTLYFDTIRFADAKEDESDWHTPFQKEVYEAMLVEFQKALTSGSGSTKTKAPADTDTSGPPRPARSNNPLWGKR